MSGACNCVGPQNGQPRCPCLMGGMIQRDGKWVQPERIVGDVVPTYHWPAHIPVPPAQCPGYGKIAPHGCVCPVGAEKTCKGALCPRRAPA